MKTFKAFKYKLEPTDSQIALFYRMAGCGRVVFNDSLEFILNILKKETGISDKKALYKHLNALPPKERIALIKKLPNAFKLNKHLTQWKKEDNRAWLKAAYTGKIYSKDKKTCQEAQANGAKASAAFPCSASAKWRTTQQCGLLILLNTAR